MDKETLSNYGWIVICVIVIGIMLGLSGTLGNKIGDGFTNVVSSISDKADSALGETEDVVPGLYVEGELQQSWEEIMDAYPEAFSSDGTKILGREEMASYFEQMSGDLVISSKVKEIGGWSFYDCNNLLSVVIGKNVKTIGDAAFYQCYALRTIQMSDSVTNVGHAPFGSAHNLQSITLSKNLNIISNNMLSCSSLVNVVIPDGVKTIDVYAFSDCAKLENVTIPASVTKINNRAFGNNHSPLGDCSSEITFKGTKAQWNNIEIDDEAFYNSLFSTIHCTDGDISL